MDIIDHRPLNVDLEKLLDKETLERVKSLLPHKERDSIEFNLRGADCSVANALRRTIVGEMPTRALHCRVEDIRTNEENIILPELADRINYIALDLDTPLDLVFAVNVVNNSLRTEKHVVYSSNIIAVVPEGKPRAAADYFDGTYRLTELRPGKYLNINNIRVREGAAYQDPCFALSGDFTYRMLDYITVHSVNGQGNIVSVLARAAELHELLKARKITYEKKPELFARSKILLIPDALSGALLSERDKKRMSGYDIVLENAAVPFYQSGEIDPADFNISFAFNGNCTAKRALFLACADLLGRLRPIGDYLREYMKKPGAVVEKHYRFSRDEQKSSLRISGEDHTVGELLRKRVYHLNPSIALVNKHIEHPLSRVVVIQLTHSQPLQLLIDAIEGLLKDFQTIQAAFA